MFLDVAIDVAIDRFDGAWQVLHRHAWYLHDAACDGVDQGEVRDDPGEKRTLGVARATQEERRCGQVVDQDGLADHSLQGFDAADPEPGGGVVLLGLSLAFGIELRTGVISRADLLAIAVVGFVVDDDDALAAEQILADALRHLAVSFGALGLALAAGQNFLRQLRRFERFALLEGVEVGDDDPGALEVVA